MVGNARKYALLLLAVSPGEAESAMCGCIYSVEVGRWVEVLWEEEMLGPRRCR